MIIKTKKINNMNKKNISFDELEKLINNLSDEASK